MRLAFAVATLLALACLLVRAGRLGMAGDYIDPFSHIGAQDEALYAHSAIQMARHGDWLTPKFMGRYGLYKPPMLAASAGLSAKILGISRLALRLPVALFASLAVGLLFWWAAELNGWQAGACAVGLLISNHLWHSLASLCLTDGLLAAFYVAAIYCLFADPWLESWGMWGFAGAVAAGILTKGIAGLFPLGVLGIYWIAAPPKYRPGFWRVVTAGALAIAAASPWFLYQMATHGRWFWAEHVQVEILGYGAGAPPQTSQENQALFYLLRAAMLDPVLLAAVAASVPAFFAALRRRSPDATLLMVAMSIPAAALLVWQYRNVSYLLPLIPMLAILASAYNPLASGKQAKWMLAMLAVAFVVKAATPTTTWGLSFEGGTRVAVAPLLSAYCEQPRGNELILVDTPDELYASLLPFPKLRYMLQATPTAPGKYGLPFQTMGIMLSAQQFNNLPPLIPQFRKQLQEWGLNSTEPIGTVIFLSSPTELVSVVETHPDSDFVLPAEDVKLLKDTYSRTHEIAIESAGYSAMLSRHGLRASAPKWTCGL